jgi:hypothetical protein
MATLALHGRYLSAGLDTRARARATIKPRGTPMNKATRARIRAGAVAVICIGEEHDKRLETLSSTASRYLCRSRYLTNLG